LSDRVLHDAVHARTGTAARAVALVNAREYAIEQPPVLVADNRALPTVRQIPLALDNGHLPTGAFRFVHAIIRAIATAQEIIVHVQIDATRRLSGGHVLNRRRFLVADVVHARYRLELFAGRYVRHKRPDIRRFVTGQRVHPTVKVEVVDGHLAFGRDQVMVHFLHVSYDATTRGFVHDALATAVAGEARHRTPFETEM